MESALAALDGADVAHVAAHGTLRGDNPLFSSLALSDGPLTAYDLERLSRAPRLVLLPACQSGAGHVRAGDEVMGLTSALFALGHAAPRWRPWCRCPDEATRPLMVSLHGGLRRGPDHRAGAGRGAGRRPTGATRPRWPRPAASSATARPAERRPAAGAPHSHVAGWTTPRGPPGHASRSGWFGGDRSPLPAAARPPSPHP